MAGSRPINYGAIAPFGKLGYRLGWRWVFFFTFSIPFHPWLFRALPVGVGLWLLWLALRDRPVDWDAPLWAAAILAIPLSVPGLQWILLAFRVHLIQAVMVPAAMVLLAIATWRGEAPPWLLALPLAYFLCHAVAVLRSRRLLNAMAAETKRIEEEAERTGPLPQVVLEGRMAYSAEHLLETISAPGVYTDNDGERRLLVRIDPTDEALMKRLEALAALPRPPVWLSKKGIARASIRIEAVPAGTPRLFRAAWSGRKRRLVGDVTAVSLAEQGAPVRTYYDGRLAPISPIPGFSFFMYLRLGSTAAYELQAGVIRGKQRIIGTLHGEQRAAARLAATLRRDEPPAPPYADWDLIAFALGEAWNARLAEELASLDTLIEAPKSWREDKLPLLRADPSLYAARAADLLAGLERARVAKRPMAGIMIGRLLAGLPQEAFESVADRLLATLGDPDMAERRDLPEFFRMADVGSLSFRGFGLLNDVPELYERLGDLGSRALPLVERLASRHGWREPLFSIFARITGRHPEA